MSNKLQTTLYHHIETEKLSFWQIFVLQLILFFSIYGIMLLPRFSTDSYSVYFYTSDGLNGLLELGRTGTYLLYKILLALGINSVTLSPVFTAVFILTVSWSAAVILSLLKPCFPHPNRLAVLLVELAVVLAYANIYFAELYFFSDVALMYTFAVLFLTLALILFFHRNRILGTILALLNLCLSLSFYQAFLGFFIIFGSMIILVQHNAPGMQKKGEHFKALLLDLLRLIAVGAGSSIGNVLSLHILASIGFSSSRGPSFSISDIFTSIQQAISQFHYYYPAGYPNYLTGFMKIIFVLSGPVLLCFLLCSFSKGRRKQYPYSSAIITLMVLLACLLSVFAPHFVAKSVWMPPRSICSFFAVLTTVIILTVYNYTQSGKTVSFSASVVVLLLLTVNIIGIQGIALDQMKLNRQDKEEAEQIVHSIQEYENESGLSVDTISWTSDGRYTWTHPNIKYSFMDMNVRAGARNWSLADCICYYAGRRFNFETMPDEIWIANFLGQDWDSFCPEEQILFDGNKMYLMVY